MRISFLMNEVAYMDYETQTVVRGWSPTDKRLGGTEESVVRWAEELVKRGHAVKVFKDNLSPARNGVLYMDFALYHSSQPGDVCINIKNSAVPPKGPTLYLTNETDANLKDLSAYDGVIWPSQWAADNIPVNNPKLFILPHGYDHTKIYPKDKVNKQCLYASSPDRGLDVLDQIWPLILDQHPDAQLYVTYGGRINAPNTIYGEFSEEEMNELYNTSDIWLHPCSGGELFGISGIKAQAAGAIPIYFPTMALAETVQSGIAVQDIREMYDALNDLLGDNDRKTALREEMAKIPQPNWETTTDRLLEIIGAIL